MADFFSSTGSSILAAVIVGALGIGTVVKVKISGRAEHSSKLGDRLIGIAWIMLIGGLILFGSHQGQFADLGKNDTYAMLGADLMGLSIPVWAAGKLSRLFFA